MGWMFVVTYGAFIELVLPLAAIGLILFRAAQSIQEKVKNDSK